MEALSILPADARPPLLSGSICVWLQELGGPRDHAAAHQLLRDILASYLRCQPKSVPLQTEAGKAPKLERYPDYALSLSYAGNLAAIGISRDNALGIDLMQTAFIPDWEAVADTFFSPERIAKLSTLPDDRQGAAFAACWSELEARSKCCGIGITEYSSARDHTLYHPAIQSSFAQNVQPGFVLAIAKSARQALPK